MSQRALWNQPVEKLELQQPCRPRKGDPPFREATSSEGGREEPREGAQAPTVPLRVPLSDRPSRALLITGHATRPGRLTRILRLLELVRRSWARGQRPGSGSPPCCGAVSATHRPWPALRVPSGCMHQAPTAHSSKQECSCNQQRLNSLQGAWSPRDRCRLGSLSVSTGVCICRVSPAHSCGPLHSPQCCPGNRPHGDPGDSLSPRAGAVVTQTSVHRSETGPGRQHSPHEPFSYPVSALPEK